MYYSNGDMDPVRVCVNSPDFRRFTKEWIDAMVEACDDMDSPKIAELIALVKDENLTEEDRKKLQQIIEYAEEYDFDEIIVMIQ